MHIILAKPRGFCAGVERAILAVERALERYGPPVYVFNDIVHNQAVVEELRAKGAIFVKDMANVPRGAHLLFSAHGVGPERWAAAKHLDLEVIDATCPLVEKVHFEARRFAKKDYTIFLIGEEGHDETVGTMGWAPENIRLVRDKAEAAAIEVENPGRVAYITQTTLSVEDCDEIIAVLRERFPELQGPPKADICYATSNRQAAVRQFAPEADLVLVVGDPESSNSTRLAELGAALGKPSHLISHAGMIQDAWLENAAVVLLTSGASVPEKLVQDVIKTLQDKRECTLEERELAPEDVYFRLPAAIA